MQATSDLVLETLRLRPSRSAAALRAAWRAAPTIGLAPLVAFEGCSLWLYRRLTELDALPDVDRTFASWLARSARRVAARNLRTRVQRDTVVTALNAFACPHVLLKGVARQLVTDVYPYADARPIGDVDILLPRDRARLAWERLCDIGFAPAPRDESRYATHHHLPPLSNGLRVPVEVHTSTAPHLAADEAWQRMTADARRIQHEGRTTAVSATTELLWHTVAHALRTPSGGAFRLRFLLDAASLWAGGDQIDWGRIAGRLAAGEVPHTILARRWLAAAAWLAGRTPPADVVADAAPFDLHRALRWRSRVCRVFASGPAIWGPAPASRVRRLLIQEATRARAGLPLAAASVGRWAAAGVARICFQAWSLVT